MNPAAHIPGFTWTDRLGLTAFVSVLVHMTVILGVGFAVPDLRSNDPLPTLDITLVASRSDTPPEQADFLAQANQQGGGDTDRAEIARSPQSSVPAPRAEAATTRVRSAAHPPQVSADQVLTQAREPASDIVAQPEREPGEAAPQADPQPLTEVARERARLSAELSSFWQEYQKRPRRKFLTARTREYKYAEYMEAWRSRVERVGNLNYPDKARRLNLTGSLMMDVAINADGSVHNLNMIKSSGIKVLDDAARRIVRLAAPYQPFPADIREDVDILHITRTWQFMHGNRLTSR